MDYAIYPLLQNCDSTKCTAQDIRIYIKYLPQKPFRLSQLGLAPSSGSSLCNKSSLLEATTYLLEECSKREAATRCGNRGMTPNY